MNFKDKVVLITGGAKGVGKGITECFLSAHATVVICGRSTPDDVPSIDGNTAHFVSCNVLDLEDIARLFETISETYKRLDVVVNNAGGAPFADAATASPRFSEKIIALNLLAPLNIAQAANRIMQDQETGGSIINIASVSALRPSPGTAAYGAAKAGLVNLTQSLAIEWAPKVRMNAIAAGLIKTEQSHLHYGDEDGIKAVEKTVPLERMASPTDIGNVCMTLASDLSSYVTGATLRVDGGGEKPAFLSASNAKDA
ncbi:MAG: SDR family oxidoreductase [Pseudomonadota bacterium]